jgi:hypothetical protein
MYTNHVHAVTVAETHSAFRLGYAVVDDGDWYFDGTRWGAGTLGDGNWTDGDYDNTDALLLGGSATISDLVTFGKSNPVNRVALLTAMPDYQWWSTFIQTLPTEPAHPLDAVMMTHRPVVNPPANLPGFLRQRGGAIIVRNTGWQTTPNFTVDASNWRGVLAPELPANAVRILVANGHVDPVYYAIVREEKTVSLYGIRVSNGLRRWTQLLDGIPVFDGPCGYPQWQGGVFANPYNAQQLLALTDAGVKTSSDGGDHFVVDRVLTALITDSGRFPLTGNFCPNGIWDKNGAGYAASHSVHYFTLAAAAFYRSDPGKMLVASPFTGVFYNPGDGKWRSLVPQMPKPLPYVSSVSFAGSGPMPRSVYVGSEGRGVFRMDGFAAAPIATFFALRDPNKEQARRMQLVDGSGQTVSGAAVRVRVLAVGKVVNRLDVVTDGQGNIVLVRGAVSPGNMVNLHFDGDATHAPCDTRFVWRP